ncbi:MAG: hypothetical protein QOG55_2730 [Acidobacteriaceae bacterium]|jgi:hypothetical protein|nr:hypothetical protein [Acidobacteriaceae bacterium]
MFQDRSDFIGEDRANGLWVLFCLRRNEAEPTLPTLKMVSMLPLLIQICCFVLAGAEAQAPMM